MSKASGIRELYALGLTTTEIAAIADCDPAYVRVCARQRVGGTSSVHDQRYIAANGGHTLIKQRRAAKRYGMDDLKAAWARDRREHRAKRREAVS